MHALVHRLRRSVLEFVALPVLIVLGFIVLAEVVDWCDNHAGPRMAWGPLRIFLSQYVGDTQAAIGVLTAIAGSLFTVTSVTFSILLLAVQQGATVLNSQVVDHYLQRRSNRAWFGFFVGVSVFVLITLVQTTHTKAPVFGVTVSTLLGAATLIALVVLIYSTVNQTRPSTVIDTIVAAAEAARRKQMTLLHNTTPAAMDTSDGSLPVVSPASGYLATLDVTALKAALEAVPGARLHLVHSVGDYVPKGATLARLHGVTEVSALQAQVLRAVTLSKERDLASDAGYSLDHIATIGWTAISTAHSDPAVGAIAVHALQHLLHAWAEPVPRRADALVHYPDTLPEQTLHAVESLVVAATESRQHQSLALLFQMLATSLPVLPEERRTQLMAVVRTAAPAIAEHLPTQALRRSAAALEQVCSSLGGHEEAESLRVAMTALVER